MKRREAKPRVLVTGASGFVGGNLCEALCTGGFEVRAVYRRAAVPRHLRALRSKGVQLVRSDLASDADLTPVVRSIDTVVHAGGMAREWGPRSEFLRQNYGATVRLVEASERAGCSTFLYVSSVAVHGFEGHIGTTEEGPYFRLPFAYQMSKKKAEDHVLRRNRSDFRTVVIRPGNVYGARDTTIFDKFFALMKLGVMGYLDRGKYLTCPTYVENLSEAVLRVIEKSPGGEVYIVTDGERLTWRVFLGSFCSEFGIKIVWLDGVPAWLARGASHVMTHLYELFGSSAPPPLNPYRIEHASHDYDFSIRKAQTVLGYGPSIHWMEGVRRTARAYLHSKEENR